MKGPEGDAEDDFPLNIELIPVLFYGWCNWCDSWFRLNGDAIMRATPFRDRSAGKKASNRHREKYHV